MDARIAPEVRQAYARARYWYVMALSAERNGRKGDALSHYASSAAARATGDRWSKLDEESNR